MTETAVAKNQVYRGELIDGMAAYARAEGVELTKKQADTALSGLLETVKGVLSDGRRVNLIGFGSFEVRYRPQRPSWNMHSKEMTTLDAHNYVYFNNGSDLSEKIKGVQFVEVEVKPNKKKWVIAESAAQ